MSDFRVQSAVGNIVESLKAQWYEDRIQTHLVHYSEDSTTESAMGVFVLVWNQKKIVFFIFWHSLSVGGHCSHYVFVETPSKKEMILEFKLQPTQISVGLTLQNIIDRIIDLGLNT